MSPKFFVHKMKEVARFLEIMRGKVFGTKKDRVQVDDEAISDEKKVYLDKKRQALDEMPQAGQDKVYRNTGGQDISAI